MSHHYVVDGYLYVNGGGRTLPDIQPDCNLVEEWSRRVSGMRVFGLPIMPLPQIVEQYEHCGFGALSELEEWGREIDEFLKQLQSPGHPKLHGLDAQVQMLKAELNKTNRKLAVVEAEVSMAWEVLDWANEPEPPVGGAVADPDQD